MRTDVLDGSAVAASLSDAATTGARLELYWIPLGAGTRVVRISGKVYEACSRSSNVDLVRTSTTPRWWPTPPMVARSSRWPPHPTPADHKRGACVGRGAWEHGGLDDSAFSATRSGGGPRASSPTFPMPSRARCGLRTIPRSSPASIIGVPCDNIIVAIKLRFWRSRRSTICASSVGPSAPWFQE